MSAAPPAPDGSALPNSLLGEADVAAVRKSRGVCQVSNSGLAAAIAASHAGPSPPSAAGPILSGAITQCRLRRWRAGDDNDQACTCYRIPDGCHNVCRGPIVGNGAAHRTHASESTPLPSRAMLVGSRQAGLPAKGKGDPKRSAFGIPLRTRGGPRARDRYFFFFSLASPLAVVPEAARAVSHGQHANMRGKPDERFAPKR
jgi:hypothetical protein